METIVNSFSRVGMTFPFPKESGKSEVEIILKQFLCCIIIYLFTHYFFGSGCSVLRVQYAGLYLVFCLARYNFSLGT